MEPDQTIKAAILKRNPVLFFALIYLLLFPLTSLIIGVQWHIHFLIIMYPFLLVLPMLFIKRIKKPYTSNATITCGMYSIRITQYNIYTDVLESDEIHDYKNMYSYKAFNSSNKGNLSSFFWIYFRDGRKLRYRLVDQGKKFASPFDVTGMVTQYLNGFNGVQTNDECKVIFMPVGLHTTKSGRFTIAFIGFVWLVFIICLIIYKKTVLYVPVLGLLFFFLAVWLQKNNEMEVYKIKKNYRPITQQRY